MKRIFLYAICALLLCCSPAIAKQVQSIDEPAKTVDELVKAFSSAEYFWQQEDVARELVARTQVCILGPVLLVIAVVGALFVKRIATGGVQGQSL